MPSCVENQQDLSFPSSAPSVVLLPSHDHRGLLSWSTSATECACFPARFQCCPGLPRFLTQTARLKSRGLSSQQVATRNDDTLRDLPLLVCTTLLLPGKSRQGLSSGCSKSLFWPPAECCQEKGMRLHWCSCYTIDLKQLNWAQHNLPKIVQKDDKFFQEEPR